MIPFSRNKHECEDCHAHFGSYDELVRHAQEAHRRHALKCAECGRLFLHERTGCTTSRKKGSARWTPAGTSFKQAFFHTASEQ